MRGGMGGGQICQQGPMLLAGQRDWTLGAKQLEATEERDTKPWLHCRIPRAPLWWPILHFSRPSEQDSARAIEGRPRTRKRPRVKGSRRYTWRERRTDRLRSS